MRFGRLLDSRLPMYLIMGLGAVVLVALASVWNQDDTVAASAEMELEIEWQSISPLPEAIPSDCDSWHKADSAIVQCVYETSTSYEQIRKYYDSQLVAQGWQLIGDEPVSFAGRDYGGRIVRYRKTRLIATIEYAGSKSGWDYALSLTWRRGEDGQRQ